MTIKLRRQCCKTLVLVTCYNDFFLISELNNSHATFSNCIAEAIHLYGYWSLFHFLSEWVLGLSYKSLYACTGNMYMHIL